MNSDKHNRVVVLRFADGIRVDIVADMTEQEAIADMTSRALAGRPPPVLPLYEAVTSIIPADRASQLLNGAAPALALVSSELRPAIPVAGILAAVRAYGPATIATAGTDTKAACEEALTRFFDHYGIAIEFGDGTPEWLKEHRRTVATAWTS
jgi:hypothetical protein